MKTMQYFTGAAAQLIAAGGTTLSRLIGRERAVRPGGGYVTVSYHGVDPVAAEIISLDGSAPLFAVFFPGTSELITLETQHIVDLANRERLRLQAEEVARANGPNGIHTNA
ncbi:MAG: hypothetical protein WBW32_10865 [Luteibacter sp.]